jgi:hypothetical protein
VKLSTDPVTRAESGVIATPTQYVAGFAEYVKPVEGPLTEIFRFTVAVPAWFHAVTT